jgi:hypothetical protein
VLGHVRHHLLRVDLLGQADHLGRQRGWQRAIAPRAVLRAMIDDCVGILCQSAPVPLCAGAWRRQGGTSRAAPCGRSPAASTRCVRSSRAGAASAPARSTLPCSGAPHRCGSSHEGISPTSSPQGAPRQPTSTVPTVTRAISFRSRGNYLAHPNCFQPRATP